MAPCLAKAKLCAGRLSCGEAVQRRGDDPYSVIPVQALARYWNPSPSESDGPRCLAKACTGVTDGQLGSNSVTL